MAVPSHTGPVDTTEATVDADDAEVGTRCGFGGGATTTVWYRFTVDEEARVRVDASASDHGIVGAVVTGAPGSFTTVSCFFSSTTFTAYPGTEYYVVLADPAWDGGGAGTVTLDRTTGEPPTASFAVSGASVAKRIGAVTLPGTPPCTERPGPPSRAR